MCLNALQEVQPCCVAACAGQRVRGDPWLYLSSLGIGSYLGEADATTDELVSLEPHSYSRPVYRNSTCSSAGHLPIADLGWRR